MTDEETSKTEVLLPSSFSWRGAVPGPPTELGSAVWIPLCCLASLSDPEPVNPCACEHLQGPWREVWTLRGEAVEKARPSVRGGEGTPTTELRGGRFTPHPRPPWQRGPFCLLPSCPPALCPLPSALWLRAFSGAEGKTQGSLGTSGAVAGDQCLRTQKTHCVISFLILSPCIILS